MTGHWFDYIIIGTIGLSIVTGLFRGFVKELVALCIWVLAFWLAYSYGYCLEPWLKPYIQDKTVCTGISFILVLLGTLAIGGILNAILGYILKHSGLSSTDRLLGMGFGVIRGIFIVALFIAVVKMTSLPENEYRQHSKFYAQFDPVVNWVSGFMPEIIKQVNVLEQRNALGRHDLPIKDHQTLSQLEEYQLIEDG